MNLDNENPEIMLYILKTMRMASKKYYTLDEMTIKRHSMALDVMRIFDRQIKEEQLDCHQRSFDPISYFLSSAYQDSESTSEKPFKPIWEFIKVLIDPKHEYFKYESENGEIQYAFWKTIETEDEFNQRKDKGVYIPYTEQIYDNPLKQPALYFRGLKINQGLIIQGGRALKMDTFFHTRADNHSKSYMGAVVAFNAEHKIKRHLIEVYYCSKYWTKNVSRRLTNGKKHFDPILNTDTIPFGGGFTGNPKTGKTYYASEEEPIMFGVHLQTPLFKTLYNGISNDPSDFFNRRKIEFPQWTYQSYTNILRTILLMEHEMHHALIGRYSPIMYYAPDLMIETDRYYKAIGVLWDIYVHYYNGSTIPVRPELPIDKQYGAEQVDGNVWWNVITNKQGHNAFFGHLTYRSGLLGLAVTTEPYKSSKVLVQRILGISFVEGQTSDTKKTHYYNGSDYIQDIKLKF